MKHISMTAAQIAEIVKGEIIGDAARCVTGVAGIKEASAEQLSFVGSRKYEEQLINAKAGIILICADLTKHQKPESTLIVCKNVDLAFATVIAMYADEPPAFVPGIHPSAVVSPEAKLGANVSINANAVIEAGAEIGDNTVIGAGCYIGHDAKVGADSLLYPNVTIMYRCIVGRKAVIHPGVVIGGDGFGFVPGPQGLVKVPQTGIVQIDDDVEIGANTTIDRARFGRTWVKTNVKIDNQVMIGHNVVIGESSIVVAQAGIAGSSELGRGVILAAQAGVNGHITLGDGVQVAGASGVLRSVPAGETVVGAPAESPRDFMARVALPGRFEKLSKKFAALQQEVAELKAALGKE
jgi:UDP-3-O-[3-hydroxymyristoyl] glucosamine N-acyltransferase